MNTANGKKTPRDTLRPAYRRADFPGGLTRGKYATQAAAASNIVVLDADVASAFPDSPSVNAALRTILGAARNLSERS